MRRAQTMPLKLMSSQRIDRPQNHKMVNIPLKISAIKHYVLYLRSLYLYRNDILPFDKS